MSSFSNTSAWRFVDVIFPRGVSFILQSMFAYNYGFDVLSFYLWGGSVISLIISFVPDPHSYILIKSNNYNANRLCGLLGVSLVLKAILVFLLFWLLFLFSSFKSGGYIEIVSIFVFSFSEFLWSTLGVLAIATDRTRKVAICGVGLRCFALIIVSFFILLRVEVWLLYLVYGGVVLVGALKLGGFGVFSLKQYKRGLYFTRISLVRYSFWNQLSSIYTSLLLQIPFILLGFFKNVSEDDIGQVGYVVRVFNLLLQPVQIIQAILIRGINQSKAGLNVVIRWVYLAVKIIGSSSILVGSLLLAYSFSDNVDSASLMIASALIIGLGSSVYYRVEFIYLIASQKEIKSYGQKILPLLGTLCVCLYFFSALFESVVAISISIVVTWVVTALAWKHASTFRIEDILRSRA